MAAPSGPVADSRLRHWRNPGSTAPSTAKWPYLRQESPGIAVALYQRMEPTHNQMSAWRCPMRQRLIDDPWAQQLLDRAEDRLGLARAFTIRRAVVGPRRRPPRAGRAWLGSLLIAMGQRLLRPVPKPAMPA